MDDPELAEPNILAFGGDAVTAAPKADGVDGVAELDPNIDPPVAAAAAVPKAD